MGADVPGTVDVDRFIAKRILAGDEKAFRELFDSFYPRLFRFAIARLNGDREAAADVVQQTFCKAIQGLDRYRGEAALYTWFCQICRNLIVDFCRKLSHQIVANYVFDISAGLESNTIIIFNQAGAESRTQ